MRILLLQDDFPPYNTGGAATAVYNLAKELKNRGNEVFIITSTQNAMPICECNANNANCEYYGLKVFHIHSAYHPRWRAYLSLYNSKTVGAVKKIMKSIRPDITHAHNVHNHLSYYCLKIAKKYSKAVFLTVHDLMLVHYGKFISKDKVCPADFLDYKITVLDRMKEAGKRYNPLRNIIIRYCLKGVDKIFCVSESLKEVLEANKIKNLAVIHNGINVEDYAASQETINEFEEEHQLTVGKIIFFAGKFSKAKGGEVILEMLGKVKNNVPGVILVIAGKQDKNSEKLLTQSVGFSVEKNIKNLGWLGKESLKFAYGAADLVIMPSICFETFGMVCLEAMASKKPVITSCLGGAREVVEDERTGYVINPYDTDNFSRKVIELLNNREKAKRFGEEGYRRVKEKFPLQEQANKTMKYYRMYSR